MVHLPWQSTWHKRSQLLEVEAFWPLTCALRQTCAASCFCQPLCVFCPFQERTIIQSSDGSRKDKLKKGEESFSVDEYSMFKQDNKPGTQRYWHRIPLCPREEIEHMYKKDHFYGWPKHSMSLDWWCNGLFGCCVAISGIPYASLTNFVLWHSHHKQPKANNTK